MNRSILLFLVALVAAAAASACTGEPEHPPVDCTRVRAAVNAAFERDMRGETQLSPDAVGELQWLEYSLCRSRPAQAPGVVPGGIAYQLQGERQSWRYRDAGIVVGLDERTGWWMATDSPDAVDVYVEGEFTWVDGARPEEGR